MYQDKSFSVSTPSLAFIARSNEMMGLNDVCKFHLRDCGDTHETAALVESF